MSKSSSKVKLELPKELAKGLKEASLLLDKSEEELIGEALAEYVKKKYGVEEFENMSVADLIRAARALELLTQHVFAMSRNVSAFASQVAPAAAAQQTEIETVERSVEELKTMVASLSSSLEELRARQALVAGGGGGQKVPTLPSPPEDLREIYDMVTTYMKNVSKELLVNIMKAGRSPAKAAPVK
ncbi:MAG: hypothetical protein ACP5I3_10035 [Thermoproteus sp.]